MGKIFLKVDIVLRTHKNVPSGGYKVIYSYANYLQKKGHQVTIWYLGDTPFRERHANFAKKLVHLIQYEHSIKNQIKMNWFKLNSNINLRYEFHLKKSFGEDSNVVVAFDYGISLYLYEHFPVQRRKMTHFIQADERIYDDASIVEKSWKLPIHNVVVSSWLKQLLDKFSVSVSLVPDYLENKEYYLEVPIEKRQKVVCLINHANPSKGTAEGLAVIKLARQKAPNLKVIMFGNELRPNELREGDQYFQSASSSELRKLVYNQSSVYLQMSHSEGWGLTAMESMACGCALLSAKNGGILDFAKPNKNAILFPVGDIERAADQLIRLITNENDRISIAREAVNDVCKYTFNRSAFLFEQVLNKMSNK